MSCKAMLTLDCLLQTNNISRFLFSGYRIWNSASCTLGLLSPVMCIHTEPRLYIRRDTPSFILDRVGMVTTSGSIFMASLILSCLTSNSLVHSQLLISICTFSIIDCLTTNLWRFGQLSHNISIAASNLRSEQSLSFRDSNSVSNSHGWYAAGYMSSSL